jgi:succinate-semialdehyde dehydrogenase / glutarate-semialdehyde dehydrogenase
MELGGSDALIVLDDADLDQTVPWAVWGRMNNGGQCCVASKRIIVAEEIADEFLERFQATLAELKAGDPFDEATTLPPMSSQGAADELNDKIKAAVEAGATGTSSPASASRNSSTRRSSTSYRSTRPGNQFPSETM